jgi:hypothetical protein
MMHAERKNGFIYYLLLLDDARLGFQSVVKSAWKWPNPGLRFWEKPAGRYCFVLVRMPAHGRRRGSRERKLSFPVVIVGKIFCHTMPARWWMSLGKLINCFLIIIRVSAEISLPTLMTLCCIFSDEGAHSLYRRLEFPLQINLI